MRIERSSRPALPLDGPPRCQSTRAAAASSLRRLLVPPPSLPAPLLASLLALSASLHALSPRTLGCSRGALSAPLGATPVQGRPSTISAPTASAPSPRLLSRLERPTQEIEEAIEGGLPQSPPSIASINRLPQPPSIIGAIGVIRSGVLGLTGCRRCTGRVGPALVSIAPLHQRHRRDSQRRPWPAPH